VPALELFLHEQFVGQVTPDGRHPGRVVLDVDPGYRPGPVLLSESFAALPGRRPPVDAVTSRPKAA
jgi:hypothetical protein